MNARRGWIETSAEVSVKRQCEVLEVNRSGVYYQAIEPTDEAIEKDGLLRDLIGKIYSLHPYFGTRRMTRHLYERGHMINRKRIQRIMGEMGLRGMAPGPDTSKPHPQDKVYPYRLRGVQVTEPNQVWSTDITYIRLPGGFVYLVAIMDWYSRRVLSWRISNTMDSHFCVECLEDALRNFGKPKIFNSDQGAQFTSEAFTRVLRGNGIEISMDGRGRALDNIYVERLWRNVKYENVYLHGYENMGELMLGLTRYFAFYNLDRQHQSLSYSTPDEVYRTGQNGGASIPDKFRVIQDNHPQTEQPCLVATSESCLS